MFLTGCGLLVALLDLLLGVDDLLCATAAFLIWLSFSSRAFVSADSFASIALRCLESKLLLLLLSALALLEERLAICNFDSVCCCIRSVALATVFADCDKRAFSGASSINFLASESLLALAASDDAALAVAVIRWLPLSFKTTSAALLCRDSYSSLIASSRAAAAWFIKPTP